MHFETVKLIVLAVKWRFCKLFMQANWRKQTVFSAIKGAVVWASLVGFSLALRHPIAAASPASESHVVAANQDPRQLLREGQQYYSAGQYLKALRTFIAGLNQAKATGNTALAKSFADLITKTEKQLSPDELTIELDREAVEHYANAGDISTEARKLIEITDIQMLRGDYVDAQKELQEALSTSERSGNGDVKAKALLLSSRMGQVAGSYSDALEAARRAYELGQSAGAVDLEAASLQQLGAVQDDLGRYGEALQSEYEAHELAMSNNDAKLQAEIFAATVSIKSHLGSPLEIATVQDDAFALMDRLKNETDSVDAEYSNYFINQISAVLLADSSKAPSVIRLEAAVFSVCDKIYANLSCSADAARNMVRALFISRDYSKALGISSELIEFDKRHSQPQLARDLENMAYIELTLGRYSDAYGSAVMAAQIDARFGMPRWKTMSIAAKAQARLGHSDKALLDFEDAITNIEQRVDLTLAYDRNAFIGTTSQVYNDYVEFLANLNERLPDRGYDQKALEIFEHQQARTFLEQIAESGASSFTACRLLLSNNRGNWRLRALRIKQRLRLQHIRTLVLAQIVLIPKLEPSTQKSGRAIPATIRC